MSTEETQSESKPVDEVEEEVEQPAPTVKAEEPVPFPEEEEIEIVEEKFYTVNLRDVWTVPRKQRAPKAVRILRDFVKRNMKAEDIKVSNGINQEIWLRSIQKPPRKLKIRVVKDKEGQVIIFPVKAA
jgi:large subunit ribosomal protein L31e